MDLHTIPRSAQTVRYINKFNYGFGMNEIKIRLFAFSKHRIGAFINNLYRMADIHRNHSLSEKYLFFL